MSEKNFNNQKDCFWQAQGLKSFVKAKPDMLQFEKVHFSFVEHSGKDNGAVQKQAVEAYIPVHGDTGALYLSQLILSGGAKALSKRNKEAAEKKKMENGDGKTVYADAIFTAIGGSKAKDNNPCQYREFKICPGLKSDYSMEIMTCEGQMTKTGGYAPAANATRTYIRVGVSTQLLCDLAVSIQSEWTAMVTAQAIANLGAKPQVQTQVQTQPQAEPKTITVEKTVEKIVAPAQIVLLYDTGNYYNQGYTVAVKLENAISKIQEIIKELLNGTNKFVSDKNDYAAAVKFIEEKKNGGATIRFTSKNNSSITTNLAVMVVDLQ